MVVPAPDSRPLEVRDADGQVIAYLVPAEQMKRLSEELGSLGEQLAAMTRQRDHHLAERIDLLKNYFPLPPTEEEMLAAAPNSHVIAEIIADLESR